METIAIEFCARRYHATPWDAHVNEGRVEWPPCPWRLLRALLAVGYNKCGWTDGPPEQATHLIDKLAKCEPTYALPRAVETHTRHYMPTRSGRSEKPVKVFDSFIRFSDPASRLLVQYDIDLDASEREQLKMLVEGMAYLGRAESWVEATLLDADHDEGTEDLQWSAVADDQPGNRTRLLAPMTFDDFDRWRSDETQQVSTAAEADAQAAADAANKKLTPAARKKARTKAEAPYPATLLDSLQQDNAKWQSEGWPRPPGSRWVDYRLPDDLFDRTPLTTLAQSPPFRRPEAILLAIDGSGKRGSIRPLRKRTLPLMELLHSESVRYSDKLDLGHVSELTGKDDEGEKRRDAHQHAHWLPLSLIDRDAIDHVLVFAPGGFSCEAVSAVSAIRWAYAKGIKTLAVNMAGQGTITEMADQLSRVNFRNASSLEILGCSRTWESATPLVLRKYLHRRGKKTIEGQIREELLERGFDPPRTVRVWTSSEMVQRKMKAYVLRRKPSKSQPPAERSWAVTIEFDEPQQGPISLGYASHFGLGVMRASTA